MFMQERHCEFDDMSFEHAKRLSRRAHQLLQPHMQHGFLMGDVDLDAVFDNIDVDVQDGVEQEDDDPLQVDGLAADPAQDDAANFEEGAQNGVIVQPPGAAHVLQGGLVPPNAEEVAGLPGGMALDDLQQILGQLG
jgi:hypothetical protein